MVTSNKFLMFSIYPSLALWRVSALTVAGFFDFRWFPLIPVDFRWFPLISVDFRWFPLISSGAKFCYGLATVWLRFRQANYLASFFSIGLMKYQYIWFLNAPKSICKPYNVREHVFSFNLWKHVFLRRSNEISTFLIFRMFCMLHLWSNLLTSQQPNLSSKSSKTLNVIRPVQKIMPSKITLAECCKHQLDRLTTLKTWRNSNSFKCH